MARRKCLSLKKETHSILWILNYSPGVQNSVEDFSESLFLHCIVVCMFIISPFTSFFRAGFFFLKKGRGAWISGFSLQECQISERFTDNVSSLITWQTLTEPLWRLLRCPCFLALQWVASSRGQGLMGPPTWHRLALFPLLVWPVGPRRTAGARLQRHRPRHSVLCKYGHWRQTERTARNLTNCLNLGITWHWGWAPVRELDALHVIK